MRAEEPDVRGRIYLAVLGVAVAGFAVLTVALLAWERLDRLEWERLDRLDVRFVDWVHDSAPTALVEAMRVSTYLGSAVVLAPLAAVAAVLLIRRGRPGAALFVASAFAGSQLLVQLLKLAFQRARPELDDPFVQLTTYSYPSGHAFGATAAYGALALVVASAVTCRRRRFGVLAVAAALIVVVAASRVVLGVHYLVDVVAGIVAGVALLSVLLYVLDRARRPDLRFVLFPRSLRGHEQPERTHLHAEL